MSADPVEMTRRRRQHQPEDGGDPVWEGSEDALALAFANGNPDLRFVARWGQWLRWNGTRWLEDETLFVFDAVRQYIRARALWLDDAAKRKAAARAKTVSAVEALARADRRLAATVDQWDADPWLLNTAGGIVDLRIGILSPHDMTRYLTKQTATGPDGDCVLWRRFLFEVADGDDDLVAYLQRVAGYCLTGSTREHAFLFFYGTGANGKGTFLNTLAGVLGDYARIAPVDVFTESHGDRHPTDLAMLRGARLVVAQETEEGRRWAESRIKALTGGDPVTARFMRQDFFTYTPQFKLLIAGNHKPILRNVDEAMRRRLHLVPFTVTIPRERRDPELADKLKLEWPGILKWAVDGCLAYQADGLAPPTGVLTATAEYFEAQDTFRTWLEEECDFGPDYWETPGRLFGSWREFALAGGYAIGTDRALGDRLEQEGFKRGRSGPRGRHWLGLRLKLREAKFDPRWGSE